MREESMEQVANLRPHAGARIFSPKPPEVAEPVLNFNRLDRGERDDEVVEIIGVDLLSGGSEARQFNALVMRDELLDVHGSEVRSLVNVDPELRYCLLRVLPLRKLKNCAYNLLLVNTAITLFCVVAEYPCIG